MMIEHRAVKEREEIYNNGGDFASNYVLFSRYHPDMCALCCFYSEHSWNSKNEEKKRSILSVTEGPTAYLVSTNNSIHDI